MAEISLRPRHVIKQSVRLRSRPRFEGPREPREGGIYKATVDLQDKRWSKTSVLLRPGFGLGRGFYIWQVRKALYVTHQEVLNCGFDGVL